ncbi:vesicle-associated protein 2-2 [Dorcoceras hygrometricum]|uniref:Vesicle-associated protein 2-2 n=1 Tax=Dorcoceras hygrometricum TaxID=472368 RepID=A0A2Z7BV76_9LAMI|nr:vesicle-associated protein 2-2 [Dorcoceras hygrometricum]
MSLFDLQDVCIVIGSLATLDLPMVIDLIGIYVLKGPYCMLTTTNWFLQALSVIPRGSWGDVARRFIMIRWASPKLRFRSHNGCGATASYLVAVGPVVDRSGIPHRTVNNVQYSIQIVESINIPSFDTVAVETVVNIETNPTVALDDTPLGDEPTVVLLPDLTTEFAQLRATLDQISLEHLQTEGDDVKKGEIKSSSRGPPSPDDQSRPGGGGGSRSEPSMKRGSGGLLSGGGRTT